MSAKSKQFAISMSKWLVSVRAVYLDTETTGLDAHAEVCDLCIMTREGESLFNSLIKPLQPIPPGATAIHGITDEMVADAPPIFKVWPKITYALNEKVIVAYNADFDTRLLYQAAANGGVGNCSINFIGVIDAMKIYSYFSGEVNPRYQTYKWHKLGDAAARCGIKSDKPLHRTEADTDLTRKLIAYIAAQG